jgi:hypothetical protein
MLPGRLHAWQSLVAPPPQGPLQQTPSTQLPFTHSMPPPQVWPSGFLSVHVPPAQYWLLGQGLDAEHPPEQTCPPGSQTPEGHCCCCAGGQDAALPGQFAARVAVGGAPPQVGDRHWTELDLNASAGHAADVPEQFSAMSQTSAAPLHGTKVPWNASVGQAAEFPVQFSATSHGPAIPRHGVCAVMNVSLGQLAELPVQFSVTSQIPAAPRHGTLDGAKPLGGQIAELPVQLSGTSQGPFTGRHTDP